MNKSRLCMLFVVMLVSLSLAGMALAADHQPQALTQVGSNGARSGTPDTTPPIEYVSPASFSEGFDDVNNLPGWYIQNNSDPLGLNNWYQGVDSVFPAHDGAPTAYIAANYNNTSDVGTISDWLLTPSQLLGDGATFSFWTRTATGSVYPDRLQVRLSTAGDSTNVGSEADDVGDFTTLLLDINPTLEVGGYPEEWTQYVLTLSGIPDGTYGRLAFRYYVTDGGPSGSNSNYIGVDTVEYNDPPASISLSQLSLHATQPPNQTSTQPLQICNGWGTDLSWKLTEIPASHADSILLIKNTDVYASVQTALDQLGYLYYMYAGDDWTGLDFSPYDVVIVAMNGGLMEPPSLLKVRTDVIDAGKRLIFLGGTSIYDFAVGVNEFLVLNDTDDTSWKISAPPHFTISDPSHPLAQGLPTPYNFVNSSAAYYMLRVTDPHIEAVAHNGDGFTSLFEKSTNFPHIQGSHPQAGGDFIWFTSPPTAIFWTAPADFAFLKQVLKNTLTAGRVMHNGGVSGAASSNSILAGSIPLVTVSVESSLGNPVGQTSSYSSGETDASASTSNPPGNTLPDNTAVDSAQVDASIASKPAQTQAGAELKGSAGSSGYGNPESVLWDNGPLVTYPAACGGMDASRLQGSLGMNTYGFGDQLSAGNHMADEFVINPGSAWNIQQITFFAYQTNAPVDPSPITGIYYQIWDGSPDNANSHIIYGDLVTNRLISSSNPNLQRDLDTSTCTNNRYVFANVASAGVILPPGTYWIDWMTDGDPAYSGPWAPPITLLGQTTTGNALQYTSSVGAWQPAMDTGTLTQQGMPFIVEGTLYNIPWLSENPTSGTTSANHCSSVTVSFNSNGLALGDYFGGVRISSNDPNAPILNVPVTLTVAYYKMYLPINLK